MMVDKDECSNCFFYRQGTNKRAKSRGLCKIDAPQFFAMAVPPQQTTNNGQDGCWPIVEPDQWCGRHEPFEFVVLGFAQGG